MFTLLFPHAAALVKTAGKSNLIIADPHLGWEMSLRQKGIHVPSQTRKLLVKLVDLLDRHSPDALLILGDIKYSVVASEPGEWWDIPKFFNELKNHVSEIGIVRGNHDANLDPMLPENVKMHPATGLAVDDVGLFHGHKWPSPSLLGCRTLVMGHLHPVVVFRDPAGFKVTRQAWMRIDVEAEALGRILLKKHGVEIEDTIEKTLQKSFKIRPRTRQMYVMPSFNDFLGGHPLNETHHQKTQDTETLIGPVLRSRAVDLENSELYLLDGTYLGAMRQFRQL